MRKLLWGVWRCGFDAGWGFFGHDMDGRVDGRYSYRPDVSGMWWKRFIGSPVAIVALSREKLEHLYTISDEQLERMQGQEKALNSEIHDITVETTRQLSVSSNKISTTKGMSKHSDEVCPANYSACERRCQQLRAVLSQLAADKDQVEIDIAESEDCLVQYAEVHQVESPVPKESLLVGPFNNTDVRKVYGQLQAMNASTTDENDREDFKFCLVILSGESKKLARWMEDMRAQFEVTCEEKQEELDALISDATRTQRAVQKIGDRMETLTKKLETLRPTLPRVRKDLQQEVQALGDTAGPLRQITAEVELLQKRRDTMKDECADITAEMLMKPIEEATKGDTMEESVQLKQQKTNLDIEMHELQQAKARNKSNIESTRESIEETRRETEEMKRQCQKIKDASDEQRWKFEKLMKANVSSNDLTMIRKWSRQMTLDELESAGGQLNDYVGQLEKRKGNMKRHISQLTEQENQYDEQISILRGLLTVGEIEEAA